MRLLLSTQNLSFGYKNNNEKILKNINLNLYKGEILAILGLSGSGKTTLCHCLSGIIPHIYEGELKGEVQIKGKSILDLDLPKIAEYIGIVFQNPETQVFFPVVEDELAFGPENLCISREEIGKRIENILSLLGKENLRYKKTKHLSGGEKQLTVLASVLALEPEILIFDEVMSQIDTKGKKLIKEIIILLKEKGKTIVMVEHDLENAEIADRKLLLKNGRLKKFAGEL
ncbi:MAG TPA: ABC transporter ATP-binding protein [Halanaerobiales bacterium]|nr:ABC transporter ATP-binding protein [Halanaerobiales bacterium]